MVLYPEKSHAKQTPSPRYEIGQLEEFWVWDLNVMPPDFRKVEAVHRVAGPNSYIFVEKKFNSLVTSTFIAKLYERLEKQGKKESIRPSLGALELNQKIFAPLPTVIHPDPRVIILLTDLGSFKGHQFNGFFNIFDQMKEQEAWESFQQHSNEVNMLYIHMKEDKALNLEHMASIIIHESQHLLSHHATDLGASFSQSSWISEIQAEAAMLFNGYYTDQKAVDRYIQRTWKTSLVSSLYVDYGVSILFASYLIDRLGAWGGFHWLTKKAIKGQEAIEKLIQTKEKAHIDFDTIYRDFIEYILKAAREEKQIPDRWQTVENKLKVGAIQPTQVIKKLPFYSQGNLETYSFAILRLDTEVHPKNLEISLKIKEPENKPTETKATTASEACDRDSFPFFWEFVPEGILLYATACPYQEEKHTVPYEIRIQEKHSPINTSNFSLNQ